MATNLAQRYRELKQSMPKEPMAKPTKRMMTSDGYMPVKPKKVGIKDVVREIPGATKKVLGAIVKAPFKFMGRQIDKDLEFKRKMYSPKTPEQIRRAEYLKDKKVK